MEAVAFALRLEGEAVELEEQRFWAESRAVAELGVSPPAGLQVATAVCRRELVLSPDGSLAQRGEIGFGAADAITFTARGAIGAGPVPALRHGTAVLEVTGGRGRLAGARGYVTSNFLLADGGGLTDHHLALLFVDPAPAGVGQRRTS